MNGPRKFFSWLILAVGIVLVLPGRADAPAKDTAFLDQPLPASLSMETETTQPDGKTVESRMIRIASFREGVELLGKISGKKVLPPEGLANWPEAYTEKNWRMGFGATKDVRKLFEQLCLTLGLDWHYDAGHDVILLKPEWQRDDSRSAKELVHVLTSIQPLPWTRLAHSTMPNRVGGHGLIPDDWRVAFDALVSKPGNFPSAGTLRFYHLTHGHVDLSPFPVFNLFAGKMSDGNGHSAIVILNGQLMRGNKDDPGDMAYYLFDEEGRLIKGGIYGMADGLQGSLGGLQADGDRGVTIDIGWGSFGLHPDHLHFGLVKDDFVLLSSTDHEGKERNAEETRSGLTMPSKEIVQLKYGVIGPGQTGL